LTEERGRALTERESGDFPKKEIATTFAGLTLQPAENPVFLFSFFLSLFPLRLDALLIFAIDGDDANDVGRPGAAAVAFESKSRDVAFY